MKLEFQRDEDELRVMRILGQEKLGEYYKKYQRTLELKEQKAALENSQKTIVDVKNSENKGKEKN